MPLLSLCVLCIMFRNGVVFWCRQDSVVFYYFWVLVFFVSLFQDSLVCVSGVVSAVFGVTAHILRHGSSVLFSIFRSMAPKSKARSKASAGLPKAAAKPKVLLLLLMGWSSPRHVFVFSTSCLQPNVLLIQVTSPLTSSQLEAVHGDTLRAELSSFSSPYLLHKELVRRGINVSFLFH